MIDKKKNGCYNEISKTWLWPLVLLLCSSTIQQHMTVLTADQYEMTLNLSDK